MAVCAGNICRSPIAEAVLRDAFIEAGLEVEVSSAGTGGWHVGEGAHERSMLVLRESGYDLDHGARQFEAGWLDECDLVLALDRRNLRDLQELAMRHGLDHDHVRLLREFDPMAAGSPSGLEVPDPYYEDVAAYREVLAMVEASAPGVVEFVRAELGRG